MFLFWGDYLGGTQSYSQDLFLTFCSMTTTVAAQVKISIEGSNLGQLYVKYKL